MLQNTLKLETRKNLFTYFGVQVKNCNSMRVGIYETNLDLKTLIETMKFTYTEGLKSTRQMYSGNKADLIYLYEFIGILFP